MDAAEFDRLVARVSDPRLISDIYNYCDGRCRRCPFTQRCLIYLDSQELDAVNLDKHSVAATMGASLRRMLGLLSGVAGREHVDIFAPGEADAEEAVDAALERHRQDPLAIRAREYSALAWRIGREIASPAAARDDASLLEAAETIGWFSSMIGSKLHRAICGQVEGWEARDEGETDFNGSAKVALIGIAESKRAWALLMEAGRATADGVPARAVIMLEALDAGIRERFPRAMEFVRPGFDQPRVAGERAR
jgi:hypothetical protein